MYKKDGMRNPSGYPDPTAYFGTMNADRDQARVNKLLHTIFSLCDLAGFRVEERIILRDKETGKVWR